MTPIYVTLNGNKNKLRAGCFEPVFGTANDAFLASNVSGTSEAYCINIDMEDVFGLQWGLRLRKNSTDRIGFIVKDDITGLDFMDKSFRFKSLGNG